MTNPVTNVPPSVFQRWMQQAASDPAIKPATVLYRKPATVQEIAQLKHQREHAEWISRKRRRA